MKKTILFFGLVFSLAFLNSCKKDKALDFDGESLEQTTSTDSRKRSCGMLEHTNKLLQDPAYRKFHEEKFKRAKSTLGQRMACAEPVVLPVAVHFQGVSNPDIACLRQLAQSQIAVLNADYTGTNSDISNWTNSASSYFPGLNNGETCVRFCLATKNHPNGYGLSEGDPAVTVNATTGDSDANWSGYINIFVQPNTGVLGYSPLGGFGNGDGVVIDASAFGTGTGCGSISPQSPYDLGRTLTHELGHYLLLDHIWGSGCGQDDGVADTPDAEQEYYACPNLGASSCGSTDMHMNYMDYTNDACMYVFSAGQSSRMENYFNANLQNVISNAASVCGEGGGGNPTEPTCDDGIQNGDETGVDCGGSNCAPCETPAVCDSPSNIQTDVDGTSVDITWDAVPAANGYRARYREEGTQNWTTEDVTATIVTLENLEEETIYQYQIRTLCSDENSPFSPVATFETEAGCTGGGHDCEGATIELLLVLDGWGSETTYELVDESGEVIASGGPFENETEGEEITDEFCLEDGCFEFVVYDEYGDGICCEYGEGFFQLLDEYGDVIAESDGYFGYFEFVDLCVENGEVEILNFRKGPRSNSLQRKTSN